MTALVYLSNCHASVQKYMCVGCVFGGACARLCSDVLPELGLVLAEQRGWSLSVILYLDIKNAFNAVNHR